MKIVVFYYSQTGQAYNAAQQIFRRQKTQPIFKEIIPKEHYPFPWRQSEFFEVFPETRLGIPTSGIQEIDFSDIDDVDIVMVVGQSWFLSPSLPLQAFFTDSKVKAFLYGKNIIFVNVCRNMWLMTLQAVRRYAAEANAHFIGHIVLQDHAPNWISAITIVRWMFYGKKTNHILPDAGVANMDLQTAARFGEIICTHHTGQSSLCSPYNSLQEKLNKAGAIVCRPSILFLERVGYRTFGFWAQFIRNKGEYKDAKRASRRNLFFAYLIVVLFIISPFAQVLFWITHPLAKRKNAPIFYSQ